MATLAQIQTFAIGNPELKQRFAAARLQAAWDILAETPPVTTRVNWAKRIFADYFSKLDEEYLRFLSHTLPQTKGNTMTDAEVVTACGSFVDAWAV